MFDQNKNTDLMLLAGRFLIAIIFIIAGFNKIMGFAGTVGYIGTVLPFPEIVAVLTILIEVGGGLMLVLGYQTKLAAGLLAGFTVLAAALFHNNFANQMDMMNFLKNMAMAGGMLYVYVFGAGRFSLDAKKSSMM